MGDCLLQRFYGCFGFKEHPFVRLLLPQKDITSTRAVKLPRVEYFQENALILLAANHLGFPPVMFQNSVASRALSEKNCQPVA